MNIKIITLDAFPTGMATTNRILSYAKGLSEIGCNVTVICVKPTEEPDLVFNYETQGQVGLVQFKYSTATTIKSRNYIVRQLVNISGVFNTCRNLLKEKSSEKTDVIIYYATSTFLAGILLMISRFKNILFIKEENEHPDVHTRNKSLIT